MEGGDLLRVVTVALLTVCSVQQDFIQILGYQKLPMAMKLYVDQYGHSGAPQAVYTPVAAATGSMLRPSMPALPQLSTELGGAAFPGGLASLLRQFGSASAPEREGFSTLGGMNVEAEGPPSSSSSLMKSLQMSLGGAQGAALNLDPSMILRGMADSQYPAAETEGGGGSGPSSILSRLRLPNMSGSGGALNMGSMFLPQLSSGSPEMKNQFGLPGQLGHNPALLANLKKLLAGGSVRARRAVTGQQSAANGPMDMSILATLKRQLKDALLKRISTKPSPGQSNYQQQSGIAIFGAEIPTSTIATTSSKAKIVPKNPNMPDLRRVHIRKALRKNTSGHTKSTILKTSHSKVANAANANAAILRPSINNPRPRFTKLRQQSGQNSVLSPLFPDSLQTRMSFLNPAGPGANSIFSSLLNQGRANTMQSIRHIQCVPGRTVPPEVMTIGPMSEIQRYECVIPLRDHSERLVGSFTVQHGESPVTCNVDHDRVQISGDIVQPICVHN